MNYFTPGPRQAIRILDRLGRRLDLVWQRRKLARLESRLGLLGWQQADYDPGTQQHVDRLNDVERAQGQLTNESATRGLTLQQLEERRVAEKASFEQQRAKRIAARAPLLGPLEEAEEALATTQRECAELTERVASLEREIAAGEERYRSLLAKGELDADQDAEVHRLQRRSIAVPREKQEWQLKLHEAQAGLPRLEIEARQRRALVSVETEGLRVLEENFATTDEALGKEIAGHKREKQKLERHIESLEKTKTQPYREIGRALADHDIAPMNQPEALEAVLAQRKAIAAQERRQAASLQASARENRRAVWISWALLCALAVLVVIGIRSFHE